ncbi:MAG: hypothetical protein IJ408_05475 [Clostridia bacterium]|nr:hypothetical protein [Clostridia bacterium]
MTTFLATLTPMLTLFFCIAVGFVLAKTNILPETGASMAMISHTLCVVTIPLMYALMITLFGTPFGI